MRITGNIKGAEDLIEKTYQMAIENKLTALEADVLFEQGLLEKDKGNIELAITKLDAAVNQYRLLGVEKSFKEAIRKLEQLKRNLNA
jgi:hypothetical protein